MSALRVTVSVFAVLASLTATLAGTPGGIAPAAAASPFDDVPDGAFYTDAVAWLAEADITTGTSPTTFSPDDPVTRGQMATFLARFADSTGTPGDHGFTDVPGGAFYDGPVSFLVDREITTGTSPSTYSPNDPVTRAQMATFLWRFSNEPDTDAAMPFTDVAGGTFYFEPVRWLADAGITTGTSPTTYAPDDTVTRGQMATFLWRLAGEPGATELGANRIDPDDTVVADATDVDVMSLDPDGASTLDWTGTDTPGVGDVVVMGITDETPAGFLGEVTQVDGDTITTQPASLQDAVPEADFEATVDLDDPSLQSQGLGLSGIDQAFDNQKASCSVDGKLFEVDLDFDLDSELDIEGSWSPGSGVQAYVGFSVTATAVVGVNVGNGVSCSAEISVDGPQLGRITFWIGGVPVVLVPEVSFEAEIGGSFAAAVEADFTYTQTVEAGLRYDDGDWSLEYDTSNGSDFDAPSITAEASAGIELRARLDVKAYDIAGPYVTVGPFFELSAQNDIPWWNIDAGVRAAVGASFELWFFDEDVEFAEIELVRFTLADSGNTPKPSPFTFLDALPVVKMDSTQNSSCAVVAGGRVACWGSNSSGQLGDGTTTSRNTAVYVDGGNLATRIKNAVDVAVGYQHACALLDDGTVRCWGLGDNGQLGNGSTADSLVPVAVAGISDAVAIDAGQRSTCAILGDLTVRCWGDNVYGQLGNGEFPTDSSTPVVVPGIDIARTISVGQRHACVTLADGRAQCWGTGGDGNLGDGTLESSGSPVDVVGLFDAIEISAGSNHTCVLRETLETNCWGWNIHGELGDGTFTQRSLFDASKTPATAGNATTIAAGGGHSCVVLQASPDRAQCWGHNQWGQLGDDTTTIRTSPVTVANADELLSIAPGGDHTCAVYRYEAALCWGRNDFGELGNSTNTDTTAPGIPVQNPGT